MKILLIIWSTIATILLVILSITMFKDGQIKIMSPTTHQHNHQEQFQGQLMINMLYQKGDKIEWKYKEFEPEKGKTNNQQLIDFLNTLHPTSSYFAKIYWYHNYVSGAYVKIVYPTFLTEKQ